MRIAALGWAALIAATAAAFAGDDKDAALKLVGKVVSVADEGRKLEVQDKSGTFAVTVADATTIAAHKAVPIGDLPPRTRAWILGRQRDEPGSSSRNRWIESIKAALAADAFTPPPVPVNVAPEKVYWIEGLLHGEPAGRPYISTKIAPAVYEVQLDRRRPIPVVSAATREALAKGKLVFVDGQRAGDKKSKAVAATRVEVLAPEIPMAEYRFILGL